MKLVQYGIVFLLLLAASSCQQSSEKRELTRKRGDSEALDSIQTAILSGKTLRERDYEVLVNVASSQSASAFRAATILVLVKDAPGFDSDRTWSVLANKLRTTRNASRSAYIKLFMQATKMVDSPVQHGSTKITKRPSSDHVILERAEWRYWVVDTLKTGDATAIAETTNALLDNEHTPEGVASLNDLILANQKELGPEAITYMKVVLKSLLPR